jgi:hypothetical protein
LIEERERKIGKINPVKKESSGFGDEYLFVRREEIMYVILFLTMKKA